MNKLQEQKIKELHGIVDSLNQSKLFGARALAHGFYTVKCFNPEGELKWTTDVEGNEIVEEGLDHLLDATLAGGSQITTWYLGLTDGTPTPDSTDTLASHVGWVEVSDYSEAARQTWTAGTVSGQSVDNTGNEASFSINANSTTIGGAFLCSASTGTSGTLYSVGAFTGGDKSADSGDTLQVTYTTTMADDGV